MDTAIERNIISRVHDGMTFFFTLEAFYSDKDEIGFYFDFLGFPHRIHRDSIYGNHIMYWIENMYGDFKPK